MNSTVILTAALCVAGTGIARATAIEYGVPSRLIDAAAIVSAMCGVALSGAIDADGPAAVVDAITIACGVVCSTTDLQSGYVFDRVLLPSAVASVCTAFVAGTLESRLAGALAAAAALLVVFAASRGRGLGFGDVKLAAVLGFGLGPMAAMTALWCAFVLAGAVGVILLLVRRVTTKSELRFAPFLSLGAGIALIGSR
jgi:leader peptidase (prepilin peptidase)/N-methyltransferase